jgi:DNA repair protein RecO (recombination protein O)
MSYRTQAIILNIDDWQEASQLFTFYTQQLGKVVALGRGTKKIISKLNNQLQFFAVVDLLVVSGKAFDHITAAALLTNFAQLKQDYRTIIAASYGLELVNQLTRPADPDPAIFDLLLRYCQALNAVNPSDFSRVWPKLKRHFTLELLQLLGFQPTGAVAGNQRQLDLFLEDHLRRPLQTESLLAQFT